MTYYTQGDPLWAAHPYAGETMAVAGCGPTSVACIIDKRPDVVADYMTSIGGASNGQGTYWWAIKSALEHYGFETEQMGPEKAYEWLDKMKSGNYYGVMLMGKGFFANAGHYITALGVDANNNVTVHDVAYPLRSGTFPWSGIVPAGQPGACMTGCTYFAGRIKQIYLVKKGAKGDLEVDGIWGMDTTKKAQAVFGTTADGIISNQSKAIRPYLTHCLASSWEFVAPDKLKNGSALIKAIQKKLGITADGFVGMNTITKLQTFLGVAVDGIVGPATVAAVQRWLNNQL